MKFKKTFVTFLISLILLNITLIYATNINTQNTDKYLRIHVVSNSDSIDDQLIKYTIAKDVDKYISDLTKNSSSKEQSKKIIEENIQGILNICSNIIKNQNSDYDIKARIGKMEYSTKSKDGIIMNSGVYDSLKIIIGNGNGENWWSLIYPTTFQDILVEDAFNENTTYSLGILEFIQNIFSTEKTTQTNELF